MGNAFETTTVTSEQSPDTSSKTASEISINPPPVDQQLIVTQDKIVPQSTDSLLTKRRFSDEFQDTSRRDSSPELQQDQKSCYLDRITEFATQVKLSNITKAVCKSAVLAGGVSPRSDVEMVVNYGLVASQSDLGINGTLRGSNEYKTYLESEILRLEKLIKSGNILLDALKEDTKFYKDQLMKVYGTFISRLGVIRLQKMDCNLVDEDVSYEKRQYIVSYSNNTISVRPNYPVESGVHDTSFSLTCLDIPMSLGDGSHLSHTELERFVKSCQPIYEAIIVQNPAVYALFGENNCLDYLFSFNQLNASLNLRILTTQQIISHNTELVSKIPKIKTMFDNLVLQKLSIFVDRNTVVNPCIKPPRTYGFVLSDTLDILDNHVKCWGFRLQDLKSRLPKICNTLGFEAYLDYVVQKCKLCSKSIGKLIYIAECGHRFCMDCGISMILSTTDLGTIMCKICQQDNYHASWVPAVDWKISERSNEIREFIWGSKAACLYDILSKCSLVDTLIICSDVNYAGNINKFLRSDEGFCAKSGSEIAPTFFHRVVWGSINYFICDMETLLGSMEIPQIARVIFTTEIGTENKEAILSRILNSTYGKLEVQYMSTTEIDKHVIELS